VSGSEDLPLERNVHPVRREHRQAVLRIARLRPGCGPGELAGEQQHRYEARDDKRQVPFHAGTVRTRSREH
jgi:hypothetical protein